MASEFVNSQQGRLRWVLCLAGLFPHTWPLPLTRQGMIDAAQNPTPQPLPIGPMAVKKQPIHHAQDGPPVIKTEKVLCCFAYTI